MGWAFLTRAGSERDLVDELGPKLEPRHPAEGVVLAIDRPLLPSGALGEPAFARQAMRTAGRAPCDDFEAIAQRLAEAMRGRLPKDKNTPPWTWCLQIVAPDSSHPHDPRRRLVGKLMEALPDLLAAHLSPAVLEAQNKEAVESERVVQVWALDDKEVLLGITPTTDVLSVRPGGKHRLKRSADDASRAGLKLEEAIEWIGVGPEKGELCADLGAAPGGWTQVALRRGAAVIAVDPAKIALDLPKSRFTHLQQSAFEFAPPETLDWLLCDMAWRPLEVAKLVAKWGKRGWAQQLLMNLKLPMKKKAMILAECVALLEGSGWRGVRARQLYHDRDEVTLYAWLDTGLVARGATKPFEFRSRKNAPKAKTVPRKKRVPRRSTDKNRPPGRPSPKNPSR